MAGILDYMLSGECIVSVVVVGIWIDSWWGRPGYLYAH